MLQLKNTCHKCCSKRLVTNVAAKGLSQMLQQKACHKCCSKHFCHKCCSNVPYQVQIFRADGWFSVLVQSIIKRYITKCPLVCCGSLLESWQRVEQSTVNRKSPTADPVFSQVPGRRVEKKGSEKGVNECLVCNNKLIKRKEQAESD